MRQQLRAQQVSHKELCARRSGQLVPGGPLSPEPTDARIPILLVHQPGAPRLFSYVCMYVF